MFPEIRLSNLNEGGVRLNLKQRKKASEEFEKPRSREKLKKGDECEEEEGGSEEGKSWGEGGEANCLHLGNIEKSTRSKTGHTRNADANASDWSPSGRRRAGEE